MNSSNYDIPVVLFVFRRVDTVKLIIEKLSEIKPKTLYIFADGARSGREDEQVKVQVVRDYLDSAITWQCNLHKKYAKENKGCAKNICEGVDYVFAREKKAIILEDDAVPMKEFFCYCEILLDKYEQDKRIQYIAGFNAIGDSECIKDSYCFAYTAPMSGAIATWADRWNECDFTMKSWPERRKEGTLRKYYFTREMYHETYKAFDDSRKSCSEGWDYQFHYDMLDKQRYAIVPKGNLVRSYGYTEGAFHVQGERVAAKLIKIMDFTKREFGFPLTEPEGMTWNKEYDKLRQKYYLSVNGRYFERHLKYAKRWIKDVAYQFMPRKLWDLLKKVLKN